MLLPHFILQCEHFVVSLGVEYGEQADRFKGSTCVGSRFLDGIQYPDINLPEVLIDQYHLRDDDGDKHGH